jgi:hypothetical protein
MGPRSGPVWALWGGAAQQAEWALWSQHRLDIVRARSPNKLAEYGPHRLRAISLHNFQLQLQHRHYRHRGSTSLFVRGAEESFVALKVCQRLKDGE